MISYQLEKTPLWLDIKSIFSSGKKPVKMEYRAMLHTVREDIPILKVISIDVLRDYVNHIGDVIQIEFKMALGDYMLRLYPQRTNLELTIKQIQLEESTTQKEQNTLIFTERYKAVFNADINPTYNATELEMVDIESLNKLDVVEVKLQLLNRSLEPIRVKTVSGIFKQVTQKKLIYNLLAGESSQILVDGKAAIQAIDIVEPDNPEIRKHSIIPDGTLLSSLPSFLQEEMGGVYNTGIGTYLQPYNQKQTWFVYPLFNYTRFDQDVTKVIFYAIPEYRFPSLDRTYLQDGKTIRVLVTAKKKYKDNADTEYMNKGVGFRMADARAFMKKPVVITEQGPVASRVNLNFEVAATERADGLNFVPTSASRISSNPFKEYSRVTRYSLSQIDLVWENSNQLLLYPGMPCKFVFMDNNKLVELRGTLLHTHTVIALQGNTINDVVYKSITHLSIAAESYQFTPELPKIDPAGVF